MSKMPAEEPHFFVNDFMVESENLKGIFTALNTKQPPYYEKSRFLRSFTNEMFTAYRRFSPRWAKKEKENFVIRIKEAEKETEELDSYLTKREENREALRQELLRKKEELLKKMSEAETLHDESKSVKNISSTLPPLIKPALKPLLNSAELPPPLEPSEIKLPEKSVLKSDETEKEDKIMPLLNDPKIQEIICDGPDESLKVQIDNKESLASINLTSEEINNFVKDMAVKTKQEISEENPFLLAETENFTIQGTLGTEHSQPRFVIVKK